MTTYTIPSTDVRVASLPKVGRAIRKPVHSFQVRYRPFAIQPFLIAPVLPGETMKNLLMQARTYTDPLVNGNIGWHNEFYFFYVKLRDLPERAAIEQMLIANAAAPAASTALPTMYYNGEGVDWVTKCLNRVVETFFRSEEENASGVNLFNADNIPVAHLNSAPGWQENLKAHSDAPASDGTALPGDHFPELPEHLSAFADAYTTWQQMQSLELTPPSFEDYLKTFGIRPPVAAREEKHMPELLRYVRQWNTPKTAMVGGTASSIVSWDISERADKDRFFSEPGFVFGVTTARAKMYAGAQKANMSSFLNDAYSWLPALLRPDPFTSLKKFAFGGAGPLDITEDYWVDLADLFHGGDQFINFPLTDTAANLNASPFESGWQIDLVKEYPALASIEALFAAPASNKVHCEGRVDMSILTSLQDTTP